MTSVPLLLQTRLLAGRGEIFSSSAKCLAFIEPLFMCRRDSL